MIQWYGFEDVSTDTVPRPVALHTTYAYDYDLCLCLSEVTTVRRLRKPLYDYRRHGGTISSQKRQGAPKRQEQMRDAYQAIFAALQRRGLVDRYAPRVPASEGHTAAIYPRNAARTPR